MAKRSTAAQPEIATPEEVLRTFTQIMRGEMTEAGVRRSGEDVPQPPKISERSKAAELLGKRYGLFSDREDGGATRAELAAEIESAMEALRQGHAD